MHIYISYDNQKQLNCNNSNRNSPNLCNKSSENKMSGLGTSVTQCKGLIQRRKVSSERLTDRCHIEALITYASLRFVC